MRDCTDARPVADADIILKDVSGKTWEAKTDRDGKYIFNLKQNFSSDVQVSIKKALYNDFTSASNIVTTDETNLLVDVLINADLCIEKSAVVPPVEEKLVIKAENVSTVYFDFDKSSLNNEALAILDSISNVLIDNPSATVQISGYTDGLGKVEYNNKLSDKRARACGNYLIQKGIDQGRVTFVSFGACCPVEMEIINGRDNSDGRSRNRRALLNIDNPLVLPKGEK